MFASVEARLVSRLEVEGWCLLFADAQHTCHGCRCSALASTPMACTIRQTACTASRLPSGEPSRCVQDALTLILTAVHMDQASTTGARLPRRPVPIFQLVAQELMFFASVG